MYINSLIHSVFNGVPVKTGCKDSNFYKALFSFSKKIFSNLKTFMIFDGYN